MTDEVKTETPTEQPQAAQPQGPDLNLTDLAALKSIIEVATQRGAFKAAELESVGKVFNKLSNFLDSVSKKEA
jgi:hypothetical protein